MLTKSVHIIVRSLAASMLVLVVGCGGDDNSNNPDNKTVPVLTTAAVSAITETTAQCGGTVTSHGGEAVMARGVCWSTSPTPTVAGSKTDDGRGTVLLSGLLELSSPPQPTANTSIDAVRDRTIMRTNFVNIATSVIDIYAAGAQLTRRCRSLGLRTSS